MIVHAMPTNAQDVFFPNTEQVMNVEHLTPKPLRLDRDKVGNFRGDKKQFEALGKSVFVVMNQTERRFKHVQT